MSYSPFTATGDGSTTAYTIAFEYIDTADIKARVNDVLTTAFSVSGSTVTFTTAPPSGQSVKIFRDTDNQTIQADFQSGSALRAVDLNSNFTQLLYVTQESTDVADTATSDATNSVATSNAAVATANTASTNATNAVNTANTASTTATTAFNTANAATTTANAATTTANTASTNASAAVTTANTANTTAGSAVTTANSAVSTANTANTTAGNAVTTANSASSTANTANTSATAAVATANAAQSAVSGAAFYSPVANVAGIPASPSDNDRVEVADSTGIQSFTPLTGYPVGFTGSSGLTARIQYSSSGSTWNWVDYFANDPEDRYFTKASGNTNTTNIATNVTNIAANVTTLATKMPLAGGTFTGAVSFDDNVIVKGDPTAGTSGEITLNCENNSHGVKIKGPPHSAGASYTLQLPNDIGSANQLLKVDGAGHLSWGYPDLIESSSGTNKITAGGTELNFYTNITNQLTLGTTGDLTLMYGDLKFWGGFTNNFLTIKRASGSQSYDLTLPTGPGTSGQALTTDGSGVLSFNTISTIAICDGGNFANGSSLVQTSTTFDGGSF